MGIRLRLIGVRDLHSRCGNEKGYLLGEVVGDSEAIQLDIAWISTGVGLSSGNQALMRCAFIDTDLNAIGAGRYPLLLGQNHNLATGFVLFHASMCFNDIVKMKDFADLDAQCARRDLFN